MQNLYELKCLMTVLKLLSAAHINNAPFDWTVVNGDVVCFFKFKYMRCLFIKHKVPIKNTSISSINRQNLHFHRISITGFLAQSTNMICLWSNLNITFIEYIFCNKCSVDNHNLIDCWKPVGNKMNHLTSLRFDASKESHKVQTRSR